MAKFTTITIPRDVLLELENFKKSVGAKSYAEAIRMLIEIWKENRKKKFILDVMKAREMGLDDVKSVIKEMREKKWARFS